jgi:hypothetical protein
MARRVVARVPADLLHHGRVLRPIDAENVYSNPRAEFARLEQAGALHRLATGLFAAVPDDRVGKDWRPSLEGVALGVAGAGGYTDASVLMGISAARIHGAVPRALNVAVVAVERHRRTLHLADRKATVLFVRRNIARLDVQSHRTELGQGWITTVEQTLLDLIARPELGDVPDAVHEAVRALIPRADVPLLHDLATEQHRSRALDGALAAHGAA